MNTRELRMVIRARADTASAFNSVTSQMRGIQYQIGFFNAHNLNVARAVSQVFAGAGAAVVHSGSLISRAVLSIGSAHAHSATQARGAMAQQQQAMRTLVADIRQAQRIHVQAQNAANAASSATLRALNAESAAAQRVRNAFSRVGGVNTSIAANQNAAHAAAVLKVVSAQQLLARSSANVTSVRASASQAITNAIGAERLAIQRVHQATLAQAATQASVASRQVSANVRVLASENALMNIRQRIRVASIVGAVPAYLTNAEHLAVQKLNQARLSLTTVTASTAASQSAAILRVGNAQQALVQATRNVGAVRTSTSAAVVRALAEEHAATQRVRQAILALASARILTPGDAARRNAAQLQLNNARTALTAANYNVGTARAQQGMAGARVGATGTALSSLQSQVGPLQTIISAMSSAIALSARWANALGIVSGIVSGVSNVFGSLLATIGSVGNVIIQTFLAIGQVVLHVVLQAVHFLIAAFEKLVVAVGIAGTALSAVMSIVGKMGLDFDSFKEQAMVSFEVIFKSADEAKQKFDFLKHFADITPFDTKEVIETGKRLAAYGLDIERFITVAGNMSAAFNRPLEQAVDLLGRAKSGLFLTRQMAEFGITRDKLQSVGLQFQKSGAPIDRTKLLDAVEAVVQRDFGGLMTRQAFTDKGLTSTLLAFFTEELPGAVTEGLFRASKGIKFFLVQFIELMHANGQLDVFVRGVSQVFDMVGIAATAAAQKIPQLVAWFNELVTTGKWQKFLEIVYSVFTAVISVIGKAIAWITANWSKIWATIVAVTIAAVKIIGGLMAGVINIFVEAVGGNIDLQREFINLGTAARTFALDAVHSVGGLIKMMLALQMIVGGVMLGFGLVTGNAPMAAEGAAELITSGIGAAGMGFMQGKIEKSLKSFDPAKTIGAIQHQGTQKNAFGAFLRGYQSFGTGVDQFVANVSQGSKLPGINDLPPPPDINTGGVAGDVSDAEELAKAAAKEHLDVLEAMAESWSQVVDAAKEYAGVMLAAPDASLMVASAMLGQLGALRQLIQGQGEYLATLDAGSEDWLKVIGHMNKATAEADKLRGELRDVIFSVRELSSALEESEKLFKLGQDAGFSTDDQQKIATQQFDLLQQTLEVERLRLATMQDGTEEWYKQRGTIIDIISKMVELKKNLREGANAVAASQLMTPFAPYGYAGAPFGAEAVRGTPAGPDAGWVKELLDYALNPTKIDLDAVGGAMPAFEGPLKPVTPIDLSDNNAPLAGSIAGALAPYFKDLGDRLLGMPTGTNTVPNGTATPYGYYNSSYSGTATFSSGSRLPDGSPGPDVSSSGLGIPFVSGMATLNAMMGMAQIGQMDSSFRTPQENAAAERARVNHISGTHPLMGNNDWMYRNWHEPLPSGPGDLPFPRYREPLPPGPGLPSGSGVYPAYNTPFPSGPNPTDWNRDMMWMRQRGLSYFNNKVAGNSGYPDRNAPYGNNSGYPDRGTYTAIPSLQYAPPHEIQETQGPPSGLGYGDITPAISGPGNMLPYGWYDYRQSRVNPHNFMPRDQPSFSMDDGPTQYIPQQYIGGDNGRSMDFTVNINAGVPTFSDEQADESFKRAVHEEVDRKLDDFLDRLRAARVMRGGSG